MPKPKRVKVDDDGIEEAGLVSSSALDEDGPEICAPCLGKGCEECGFSGYEIDPELKIIEEFEERIENKIA